MSLRRFASDYYLLPTWLLRMSKRLASSKLLLMATRHYFGWKGDSPATTRLLRGTPPAPN
eukprot:2630250-Karenia_brevis.AAC.1